MKNILKTYALGIALGVGVSMFMAHEAQAAMGMKDKKTSSRTVTGTIVDESRQAVEGTVVTVKNADKKAKTKTNGQFSIKAGENDTLVFTAPVKETLKIAVKDIKPKKEITMKWLQSESDEVVIMAEQMPQFPFGDPVYWIVRNMKYPLEAQKQKQEGKVFVQFVIERDGSVSHVRTLTNNSCPFPILHEEAIRVVRMMPPWKPGIQKGRTVRVRYAMPINFRLSK